MSDPLNYKKANPQSTDIELAQVAFSNEPPIKYRKNCANCILGIFKRGNFTPLPKMFPALIYLACILILWRVLK